MQYAHKQWDKLTAYTQDGRLKIDNNLTENAIRPFVIGRKNWLFCDSVAVWLQANSTNTELNELDDTGSQGHRLDGDAYATLIEPVRRFVGRNT